MIDSPDQEFDQALNRAIEALRQTPVPDGPPPETVTAVLRLVEEASVVPLTIAERINKMAKSFPSKVAAAASIVALLGGIIVWAAIGLGSSSLAFARVADALDSLRTATFDITSEAKKSDRQPAVTATGKGYFMAPSRQRTEVSAGAGKNASSMITIADGQAAKALMLMPSMKVAVAMDMEKMRSELKKSGKGGPADLFDMVRRLVREGSSGTGEQAERLGSKEIDGHKAIGFRTHNPMGDMILWADPETARPVRIELSGEMFAQVQMVMSNFRYDVDLDASLFSTDPPADYSSQTMNVTAPVEADLIRTLRMVATHRKGQFPAKLGMNKEVMEAFAAMVKPEMERLEAKYHVKPKAGEQPPAAMMAEIMKTAMPLMQKEMQGISFYATLKPENDAHYAGEGVKLDTADRPIFWYKPTGSEKYHVVYADLSVKEMSPEEAKKLGGATAK